MTKRKQFLGNYSKRDIWHEHFVLQMKFEFIGGREDTKIIKI